MTILSAPEHALDGAIVQPGLKRAARSEVTLRIDMVGVPVSVFGAVEEDDSGALNQLCYNGHEPVRVKRSFVCPTCSETRGHVKGQQKGDGYVVVPEAVIAQAAEADKFAHDEITLSVHRTAEVNLAMPAGKSYYLDVSKRHPTSRKLYAALAQVIDSRPDLTLVGTFANRSSAYRYSLIASHGTLMLRQMAEPTQVRQRPVIDSVAGADDVDLLSKILELSVKPFDPLTRASKRSAVIAAYVDGAQVSGPGPVLSERDGAVATLIADAEAAVDISSQLNAMLAAAEQRAAAAAAPAVVEPVKPKRAPRKRAAAKPAQPVERAVTEPVKPVRRRAVKAASTNTASKES